MALAAAAASSSRRRRTASCRSSVATLLQIGDMEAGRGGGGGWAGNDRAKDWTGEDRGSTIPVRYTQGCRSGTLHARRIYRCARTSSVENVYGRIDQIELNLKQTQSSPTRPSQLDLNRYGLDSTRPDPTTQPKLT